MWRFQVVQAILCVPNALTDFRLIALFLPIVESLSHSDFTPLDWVTIYLIATYLFM